MTYKDRRNQRLEAEYRWHITDYNCEAENDFPRARRFDTFGTRAFLAYMAPMSKEEQLHRLLAYNLVEYGRESDEIGTKVTVEDTLTAKETRDNVSNLAAKMENLEIDTVLPIEHKLGKPRVLSFITNGLRSELGKGRVNRAEGDINFVTDIGGWYLHTYVQTSSHSYIRMLMCHVIRRWSDEAIPWWGELSRLEGMPELIWNLWDESHLEPTLESMKLSLQYKIAAAVEIASRITDFSPYPSEDNRKYLKDPAGELTQ